MDVYGEVTASQRTCYSIPFFVMPQEYTGKIGQQQLSQGRGKEESEKEGGLAIDLEMSRLSTLDTGSLRNAPKGCSNILE